MTFSFAGASTTPNGVKGTFSSGSTFSVATPPSGTNQSCSVIMGIKGVSGSILAKSSSGNNPYVSGFYIKDGTIISKKEYGSGQSFSLLSADYLVLDLNMHTDVKKEFQITYTANYNGHL